jgi:hypothetical protein
MKTNNNKNATPASHPLTFALVTLVERNKFEICQETLRQQLSSIKDFAGFLRSAPTLGFEVTLMHVAIEKLHRLELPVLAFINESTEGTPANNIEHPVRVTSTEHASRRCDWPCLVVRADEHRVVYVDPANQVPVVASRREFGNRFTGDIVVVNARSKTLEDVGDPGVQRKARTDEAAQDNSHGSGRPSPTAMRAITLAHELITLVGQMNQLAIQLVDLASQCAKMNNQTTVSSPPKRETTRLVESASENQQEDESRSE